MLFGIIDRYVYLVTGITATISIASPSCAWGLHHTTTMYVWRCNMRTKFTIAGVKTRMSEDHDTVYTELTVDTSKLSEEQVREYAAMKAVVPWQSLIRSKKEIPTIATYVISPVGMRTSQPIDHAAALVKALGPDVAYKAIQKFGSAEQACEALKALVDVDMENE
jgi:hypothetical protein